MTRFRVEVALLGIFVQKLQIFLREKGEEGERKVQKKLTSPFNVFPFPLEVSNVFLK